jgi:hypothetical protein
VGGIITHNDDQNIRRPRSQWFALWYFSISLGFVLLAIRSYLIGGKPAWVVLRLVIAAAFALLGYVELRLRKTRR